MSVGRGVTYETCNDEEPKLAMITCMVKYTFMEGNVNNNVISRNELILIFANHIETFDRNKMEILEGMILFKKKVCFVGKQLLFPVNMYHDCVLLSNNCIPGKSLIYDHKWKANNRVNISGFVRNGTAQLYDRAEEIFVDRKSKFMNKHSKIVNDE